MRHTNVFFETNQLAQVSYFVVPDSMAWAFFDAPKSGPASETPVHSFLILSAKTVAGAHPSQQPLNQYDQDQNRQHEAEVVLQRGGQADALAAVGLG